MDGIGWYLGGVRYIHTKSAFLSDPGLKYCQVCLHCLLMLRELGAIMSLDGDAGGGATCPADLMDTVICDLRPVQQI